MASPRNQNPEQELSSDQSYEQDLELNYPPSQRAGIRASDQRASYQAATLKLNAEKEAQNIRDNSIRLGIAQAVEARAIKADALAIKSSTAELAVKEWEAKRNEMALDQVPLMVAEIEKRRGPKGYLSTADETAVRLSLPYAAFSKNATINKIWEDEGSLRRSLMATEAANLEIIAKEERDKAASIAAEQRKEKATGVPKTTLTTLEGIDAETGKPYTQKRRSITGSQEEIEQYERTVTPPSGKAFLETLGIKTKPEKVKYVDGTPEG